MGPKVFPRVLIRFGLWCIGLWCAKRIYSGIVCGYFGVFGLPSCKPSCFGRKIEGRCDGVVSSVSVLYFLKFVTCVLPRSSSMMGQPPPFVFYSNWCRSRKVLL